MITVHYSYSSNPPKKFVSELDKIIFGRNPRADQCVDVDLRPDGYVSHVHACLTCEDGVYWIEDLGSENGTWVNGREVEGRTRLAPGDRIRIGYTNVEVEMESPKLHEIIISELDQTIINKEYAGSKSGMVDGTYPGKHDRTAKISIIDNKDRRISDGKSGRPVKDKGDFSSTLKQLKEEPASEGTIVTVTDATVPPFSMPLVTATEDTQKQAWLHLKALNDFTIALSPETSIESVGKILMEQLKNAIPGAQRGAVLLPDPQGELLLKAHWPPGKHSVSMTWVKRAFERREAFIWSAEKPGDNKEDINATPKSAIYYDVQSAIYLPLLSAGEALGVMYVDNYFSRDAFSQTEFELLRAIANHMAMFLRGRALKKGLHREEELRSNLLRQYSPKIAERILEKSVRLRRGGEQVDPVTILISDVRSFTAMSSKMDPDEVVGALNEMFDAFVPIVYEFNGIVDKFVGDAVLAVFGSPDCDPDQWANAVRAGLKMQEAIHLIGEGRKVRRLPVYNVGIGLHSGAVIHGFIGSSERIEYTVIGDTVNRAARFCDGAGAGEVVISKSVYERVYPIVNVYPRLIRTKHPDLEPDLEAYIVEGLKQGKD